MTVSQILKAKYAFDIFDHSIDIKKQYRDFVKVVHPDVCKDSGAGAAFEKLTKFYNEVSSSTEGFMVSSSIISYTSKFGEQRIFKYERMHEFELGETYICPNSIIYVVRPEYKALYENYIRVVSSFKYADDNMRKEMERFLPKIKLKESAANGDLILIIHKTEDLVELKHILDYKIDPRHIGWILNSLFNTSCYLGVYAHLVNGGIDLSSCYVSPKYHSVCIYGGWWYCVPNGQKMIGAAPNIYSLMSIKEKDTKIASYRLDVECIKAIGKDLLNKYDREKKLAPLHGFMIFSSESAIKEYENWSNILKSIYGKPTFVELSLINKF